MTVIVVERPLPIEDLPAPRGRDIQELVAARDQGRCRACGLAVTLRPESEPAAPGRFANLLGSAPAGGVPELGLALMCIECADELDRVMYMAGCSPYPPAGLPAAVRRFWLFAQSMVRANAEDLGVVALVGGGR